MGFTWEWLLSDGVTVRASLDRRRDIESVWIGPRLVSRAPCGAKPEGHVISLAPYRSQEARVSFDADDCRLWIGAEQIEPRAKSAALGGKSRIAVAAAVCGATLVVAGAALAGARFGREQPAPPPAQWSVTVAAQASPPPASPVDRTLRSANGLLVAHYPAGFVAKSDRAEKDEWMTVTITRAAGGDDAITLRSITSANKDDDDFASSAIGAATDAWERSDMHYEETSRREGICLGGNATISEGHLEKAGRRMQSWSCAFVHAGHGFVLGWRTFEDPTPLRTILDATVVSNEPPKEAPRAQTSNVVPAPVVVPGYYGYPYPYAYYHHPLYVAPVVATTRPASMIVHASPTGNQKAIDIDVLCDEKGACQARNPPRKH
jgi:hypothetical protein